MKNVPFNLRVTEEEKELFVRAATDSGLTLSAWVRLWLMKAANVQLMEVKEEVIPKLKATAEKIREESAPEKLAKVLEERISNPGPRELSWAVECKNCGKMTDREKPRCQHCTARL